MKNIARTLALVLALTAGVQAEAATATADLIDRKPPSIRIATPIAGAVADGVMTVAGSAWDKHRVKKVEVKVVGGRYRRAQGTKSWAADIDTTAYGSGPRTLRVRAVDRHGNKRVRSLNVTFGDKAPTEVPPPLPGNSSELTTPEGTRIEITAGAFSAEQIHAMLLENGLDAVIGPTLTVKVQSEYSSQVAASAAGSGGTYTGFSATMYLQAPVVMPSTQMNATIGHEYGHVWTLYHLYMSQQGEWQPYLQARGLAGHPKLDSNYYWSRTEIIADDYRLLFGSAAAIAERPKHMTTGLVDPRSVAGLRSFFTNTFAS